MTDILDGVTDTLNRVDTLVKNTEKSRELHKEATKLQRELLNLTKEHYKLLCHGILKMHWYAVAGDKENFLNTMQILVNIAMEGLEDE